MKIAVVFIFAVMSTTVSAYDGSALSAKITIIEPSNFPSNIMFQVDTPVSGTACTAGFWLLWSGGNYNYDATSISANNKAMLATLLTALSNNRLIDVYARKPAVGNSYCYVEYIRIK